jgi:hypothetical protein
MDANGFDALVKSVSQPGTRRRLVHLVAALPVVSLVAGLLAAEHADGQGSGAGVGGGGGRRRRRTHHHPGQGKNNRKGHDKKTCAKAGQTPQKGKRKACCQGLRTDASGRCADPVPCTGLTPTATSPTQGLQEAIEQAQTGSTLTLCAGTWNLTGTVLIDKQLTLIGAGAGATVLDGGDAVRVLQIERNATVTLQDLTITKGRTILGGGIFNEGTLTLLRVIVKGNSADLGGGILSYIATLTLEAGSSVAGNTANVGGGIYNNQGMLTMETGSSAMSNTASRSGGGIFNISGAVATLQVGSRVTGNRATDTGGGISNYDATVTLEGIDPSPIVMNNCQENCAGVAVPKCAATPVSCS